MIKFKNVSFFYPNNKDNKILKDVSFFVEKSEWLTILGNNGSGKSTITKLLCGQYDTYEGEIIIDNLIYNDKNYENIINKIAVVFQNPDNQFIGATVEEDIAFGLENKNIKSKNMNSIIDNVLSIVDMNGFRKYQPSELSGGQKQRIAIAASLALEPSILILDEATSMLDPVAKNQILEYIKYINKEKKITIISITHDVEELKFSDNILLLHNGEIVNKYTSYDLYKNKVILDKYNLEIPFLHKLKEDLNIRLNTNIFNIQDNLEGVVDKLCKLISKK